MNIFTSVIAILSVPKYAFKTAIYLLVILFVLLWLFNIPLLVGIAQDTPEQLPIILIEGYFNLFRFGLNLTPVLLLVIAMLQAVSFALKSYINTVKLTKRLDVSVPVISLIGAGCVTCGGSIVAPLISVFGLTSVAGLNEFISNSILLLAASLALYSVVKVGRVASYLLNLKGIN